MLAQPILKHQEQEKSRTLINTNSTELALILEPSAV